LFSPCYWSGKTRSVADNELIAFIYIYADRELNRAAFGDRAAGFGSRGEAPL
jgi:hypothetical protein